MEITDPGHCYALRCFDSPGVDRTVMLTFVKREGDGYPGNVGHYPGTTTQEVLRALIDRTEYVNNQIPCEENLEVLRHLRSAILQLEDRAAFRHGRVLPDIELEDIERLSTCSICGHIGCEETCRG